MISRVFWGRPLNVSAPSMMRWAGLKKLRRSLCRVQFLSVSCLRPGRRGVITWKHAWWQVVQNRGHNGCSGNYSDQSTPAPHSALWCAGKPLKAPVNKCCTAEHDYYMAGWQISVGHLSFVSRFAANSMWPRACAQHFDWLFLENSCSKIQFWKYSLISVTEGYHRWVTTTPARCPARCLLPCFHSCSQINKLLSGDLYSF